MATTRLMAPARDGLEGGVHTPGDLLRSPPARTSGVVVRPVLAAGLAFVDAARLGSMNARALVSWLETWIVTPGLMIMPSAVHEPGAGTVALAAWTSVPRGAGVDVRLDRIVAAARVRVSRTLGGLLASPADDRFLAAAIFSRRVERTSGEHGAIWRAAPRHYDRLSDVVLSLFAADALSNREEYDACLRVCDVCGLVALEPRVLARRRCAEHEISQGDP